MIHKIKKLKDHPKFDVVMATALSFLLVVVGFFILRSYAGVNLAHPDGTLVKLSTSDKIYLVQDQKLTKIPSNSVFSSWGFDYNRVKIATPIDEKMAVGGTLNFREGTILKGNDSKLRGTTDANKFWLVDYDNTGVVQRREITTGANLLSIGYNLFVDVKYVDDSELPTIKGAAVTTPNVHVEGAVIKSGSNKYVISNSQRHLIPNDPVYRSQGYNSLLDKLATAQDMQLAQGNNLSFREGTLIKITGLTTKYIIDDNGGKLTKQPFTDDAFYGLGYLDSEIIAVDSSQVANIPDGAPITLITTLGVSDQPPVAKMSATPLTGTPPLQVQFDGTASSDPSGTIIGYSWDFGDGTVDTTSGKTVSHSYTANGSYTATLSVRNGNGLTSLQTTDSKLTITVASPQTRSVTARTKAGIQVWNAQPSTDNDGALLASYIRRTKPGLLRWTAEWDFLDVVPYVFAVPQPVVKTDFTSAKYQGFFQAIKDSGTTLSIQPWMGDYQGWQSWNRDPGGNYPKIQEYQDFINRLNAAVTKYGLQSQVVFEPWNEPDLRWGSCGILGYGGAYAARNFDTTWSGEEGCIVSASGKGTAKWSGGDGTSSTSNFAQIYSALPASIPKGSGGVLSSYFIEGRTWGDPRGVLETNTNWLDASERLMNSNGVIDLHSYMCYTSSCKAISEGGAIDSSVTPQSYLDSVKASLGVWDSRMAVNGKSGMFKFMIGETADSPAGKNDASVLEAQQLQSRYDLLQSTYGDRFMGLASIMSREYYTQCRGWWQDGYDPTVLAGTPQCK